MCRMKLGSITLQTKMEELDCYCCGTPMSSRSPLNVVRIGLDILKSELTRPNSTLKVDPSILELLEDITSASDSSIDILNELLDYEHMDAGMPFIVWTSPLS